jgi:hypothetical protein
VRIRRLGVGLVLAAGVAAGAILVAWHWPVPRAGGPLVQEAYVWQRAWTPAVEEAVAQADATLQGLTILGAEVAWQGGRPRVVEVSADWAALKARGLPVGLALRVGAYGGPFDEDAEATRLVVGLAGKLIDRARAAGVTPAELQLDFDCPESRLAGYRLWIEAVRRRAGDVPVTFTALPSWLHNRTFGPLAEAADGFVLQVHSLARPADADAPLTLCDPAAARAAVEKAARFGRPFRVALPTYGYLLAFDRGGKFVGLSAEGPAPRGPADAQVRALRSDPAEMAALVRDWTADRPAKMSGIIWYRLPTRDDILCWRSTMFSLVLSGQTPQSNLRAQAVPSADGLVEIELRNTGTASAPLPARVIARWRGARLVAADAIGGYERQDGAADEVRLAATAAAALQELGPGERKAIGWLRLTEVREVQVDGVPENP